jgi:hypothetical protein
VDVWGALWLADYIGAFLSGGGDAVYYFHYLPEGLSRGHNGSLGTFEFFSADRDLKIRQPLSQYFASQLINLEWVQPGDGVHKLFPAASDISDRAGHVLVTSYAAQRPDGQWALLIINKDQENAYSVGIFFDDWAKGSIGFFAGPVSVTTFGKDQYQWRPNLNGGSADPDGPAAKSTMKGEPGTKFTLPAASVTVIRGTVSAAKTGSK